MSGTGEVEDTLGQDKPDVEEEVRGREEWKHQHGQREYYQPVCIHISMRDEKEGRKKEAR